MLSNREFGVLEFIGGPSAGKTTLASNLFAYLKNLGVAVEFARETAQEEIYRRGNLDNVVQPKLVGDMVQKYNEFKFRDSNMLVIADTSISLSTMYPDPVFPRPVMQTLVQSARHGYNIKTMYLQGYIGYVQSPGRIHTAEESLYIHEEIGKRCFYDEVYTEDDNVHTLIGMLIRWGMLSDD